MPRSIISVITSPCLAIVMAPERVMTTPHLGSRTMASSTSAPSPTRRPPKAVWAMARTRESTEPTLLRSRGFNGTSPSEKPSW